jgi:hypothetical protein
MADYNELVASLSYSSSLNMEVVCFSETSRTTQMIVGFMFTTVRDYNPCNVFSGFWL